MNKVATSLTPSRGTGIDKPSIDELLKTGSFHERLAAARAQREKALASNGEEPEQLAPVLKPWERPEYLRGEPKQARPRRPAARPVPADATAAGAGIVGPAAVPAPAAPAVLPAAEVEIVAPAVAPATSKGRLRLIQIAGGTAVGIAIGIGVGYWFADAPPPAPAPPEGYVAEAAPAVEAAVPQALAQVAASDWTGVALPGADAAPATAHSPDLSRVTSLSAALPDISTDGPVAARAAVAPRFGDAAPAPAGQEIAAPASVPAPALMRGFHMPPAPARDTGFAGLPAPVRVSVAPEIAAPSGAGAGLPGLPVAPGLITYPGALDLPFVVSPPAAGGDSALAPQEVPVPVSRPAPVRGVSIVLHAPTSLTDDEIGAATEALMTEGFEPDDAKPFDFKISETNVRYFSPEDKDAAAAVAQALDARLRDFTAFSPRPPAGMIEVWLAGRGSAPLTPVVKAQAPKKVRATPSRSAVDTLKSRLVQQLRAGSLD